MEILFRWYLELSVMLAIKMIFHFYHWKNEHIILHYAFNRVFLKNKSEDKSAAGGAELSLPCCSYTPGGWRLPECSSFTSDDIVFVMESAATSRSLRRFLLVPGRRADTNSRYSSRQPTRTAVPPCPAPPAPACSRAQLQHPALLLWNDPVLLGCLIACLAN